MAAPGRERNVRSGARDLDERTSRTASHAVLLHNFGGMLVHARR